MTSLCSFYPQWMSFFFLSPPCVFSWRHLPRIQNFPSKDSLFSNSHLLFYLLRYWILMYFYYNLQHWEGCGSATWQEICILSSNSNCRWCFKYAGRWKVKKKGGRKFCSFIFNSCLKRIEFFMMLLLFLED